METRTIILVTLDSSLTVKQAAAVIEKIETAVGDDLETLVHQEYNPEHGVVFVFPGSGVTIYQR